MILYHTSTLPIAVPNTKYSRRNLDFGAGFYLTSIKEQAIRYADRFSDRSKEVWLNVYELAEDWTRWRVKVFDSYSEEWLDFVSDCRLERATGEDDMVVGGVANDKVFETIDLYFAGTMTKEKALERLSFELPNIQYCIRSEQMLRQCLTYKESIRL